MKDRKRFYSQTGTHHQRILMIQEEEEEACLDAEGLARANKINIFFFLQHLLHTNTKPLLFRVHATIDSGTYNIYLDRKFASIHNRHICWIISALEFCIDSAKHFS